MDLFVTNPKSPFFTFVSSNLETLSDFINGEKITNGTGSDLCVSISHGVG